MLKKIMAFCLSLALVVSIVPAVSLAESSNTCEVEFYSAQYNLPIDFFANNQNIYSKVTFTAPADGDVVILTAMYDGKGALDSAVTDKVENLTPGQRKTYQTQTVKAANVETVRVFVWSDLKTIVPMAQDYGEIKRKVSSGSGSGGGGSSSSSGVSDGKTTSETVISSGNVSALVPEDTRVESGTLSLTVTELEHSASGISAGEDEVLLPLDIHIEGIASNNTVPVIITVTDTVTPGLNKGNLTLYHVENGEAVKMEEVKSLSDLTKHNQFHYDAATGTITLAMATFSEVAVVSNTENAWNGTVDTSWYTNAVAPIAENEPDYIIANADQLAGFGQIVGGMNVNTRDSFKDKTVKLISDVNLGDKDNASNLIFHPIGYYFTDDKNGDGAKGDVYSTVNSFEGTFDGNGHTISNFYHNTWEIKGDYNEGYPAGSNYYKDAMGLFGYVVNGTVKNLTVDSFSSDGEFTPTGVIAAYAVNSTFENIAITNCNPRVYNTGNGGIVGIGGNTSDTEDAELTFTNITIDNSNKISALWGSWDVACGGLVGMFRGAGHVNMKNCHVAAQLDVYNDVCGNYQYYWYRYAGMMVGTNKNMITDANGYTVPETDKFHADGCTVHFGNWNDYYYCELVANSLASYTHDHQFSRLDKVDSVNVADMTVTVGDKISKIPTSGRYNYVVVNGKAATENATCYHFVDGKIWNHEDAGKETVDVDGDGVKEEVLKEDRQHYYLPFNQLFTGYGWGVKHIPVYNGEDYAFEGITILDREVANSVEKFSSVAAESYTTGQAVTIGNLFKAIENAGVTVDTDNVQVTVSPAEEGSTANGTYSANTSDWTKGTLAFSGLGKATVTIQDYNYCKPTTIEVTIVEPKPVNKFVSNGISSVTAGEEIKLETIFSSLEDVSIDSSKVTVAVSGIDYEYTADANNWKQSVLKFNIAGNATITINDNDYCNDATASFSVVENPSFTTVLPNASEYLYRVGNKNSFKIDKVLRKTDDATINSDISIKINNLIDNSSIESKTVPSENWGTETLDFDDSFTGPVAITVDALGANPYTLNLEVVDAKNITTATGSKGDNVVLLNNVKIGSGSTVTYENCFVYGNGFTFDASGGLTKYVASQGWGIINLSNGATLDNLVIVGDVYNVFGAYSNNDYNTAAVASLGGTIQNCHISNCAAPVMARGTTKVVNTTLYGGTVANMIIKAGVNTLENVVTVNYDDERKMTGMGIVIHSDADETTKLVLNGTLKQYNFYSEGDVPNDSNAKMIYDVMFDDSCSVYHFGTAPERYVNTGVISMVNTFNEDDIMGNANTDYVGSEVKTSDFEGYVYTQPNTVGSVDNYYIQETDNHKACEQGDYLPTFEFSLGEQEISYDGDSDSRYIYGDKSGIKALYQDGDEALTLDLTKLATIYKYEGVNYAVTAKCLDSSGNALDTINGVVTLSIGGEYTLIFTVNDNLFYGTDGVAIEKSVTREYTVPLSLNVKAADIKDAVITVSPTTLEGEYVTVNLTDYKLKLEFLNCIAVTDYDSAGIGTSVDLTANISSSTFNVPNRTDGDIWQGASVITITYSDGRVLTVNLSDFEGSSPGTKTASVVTTDGVYFLTDGALNNKPTEEENKCTCTITSVTFKGENSATIINDTDVSVSWPINSSSSGGGCITPETLITLADGTQKEVQYLTEGEELLVWNLKTGSYDAAPIVFNESDAKSEYEIVHLYFSDGSDVEVIYEHGFFDVNLGKYVYIRSDNAENYLGHKFVKQGDINKNTWGTVTLTDVVVENKVTTPYSPVTFEHLCYYTDGVLSIPGGIDGMFNVFEVNTDNMAYDIKKMARDIENYGLFTYDDFKDIIPEYAYDAFNGKYLKVAIGKGYITWEDIIRLAERYGKYFK